MKRIVFYLGMVMSCISWTAAADQSDSDWGNLKFYRQQNEDLRSRGTIPHRVVFMGDSITQLWDQSKTNLFADEHYVNRGISGQTTGQMLLRFDQDVIALQPEAVVILAGTNDIAGNSGVTTTQMIADNIAAMAESARSHGIKVILGSVLPVSHYPWSPKVDAIPRIAELNRWLKQYAQEHGFTYIDYFSPMDDGHGGLKAEYSGDGVHPNTPGYDVLTKVVKSALAPVIGTD